MGHQFSIESEEAFALATERDALRDTCLMSEGDPVRDRVDGLIKCGHDEPAA